MFLGLPDLHPDPLDRGTYGSEDPDPYQNVTEPQLSKMAKMFHSLLYYFSGEFRVHPSLRTDPDQMVQSARWLRITDAQIGRRTYLGLADLGPHPVFGLDSRSRSNLSSNL